MKSLGKAPQMPTETERNRTGDGRLRVRGGDLRVGAVAVPEPTARVFGGLSGVGHGLATLFRLWSRGSAAGEGGAQPLGAEGARRDARKTRPAMDAGITGGMSLLIGGQTQRERRGA